MTIMTDVFQSEIQKSFSDKREYRHITLPNELEVMLVSINSTEKSACCCDVRVGSVSDPKDFPGLAHFLEHLLFMGTDEYPVENEYSEFLAKHGGMSNAYTAAENTVYYFDVLSDHLEEAVGRFSSFFKCPSFSIASTDREMNAVDSENSKNLQSDVWRLMQLIKSFAKEDHPVNAFSTGNLETLGGEREDGKNAREECIAFHKKYYSANVMKVAIYGKESLDELQTYAEKSFSDVPNQNLPAAPEVLPEPYGMDECSKFVEVVPIKDRQTINMYFPTPPTDEPREKTVTGNSEYKPLYYSNPIRYLSHLLGHEGKGSVLYALKQKNLATGLSAGLQSSTFHGMFMVQIELTEMGLQNTNAVIACVFSYLGMLKRVHSHLSESYEDTCTETKESLLWIPQEIYDIEKCGFRFKQEGQPSDEVINIANTMQTYPIEHTLTNSQILYDIHKTQQLMVDLYFGCRNDKDCFSVENSLVVVQAKAFAGKTTLKEKWYQTDYNIYEYADLRNGAFTRWKAAYGGKDEEWSNEVHLPKMNDLLPTDFTLKHEAPQTAANGKKTKSMNPVIVEDVGHSASSRGKGKEKIAPKTSGVMWHLPDHKWGQPQTRLNLRLWGPNLIGNAASVQSFVLADIYSGMMDELLNEQLYYAECAMLKYSMSVERGSLTMKLRGYSHKIQRLLEIVLEEMKKIGTSGNCDESIFERVKEFQLRTYKNLGVFATPTTMAIRCTTEYIMEPMFSPMEKYRILQSLTLAQFENFASALVQETIEDGSGGGLGLHTECFCFGNITEEETKSLLHDTISSTLKFTPLPLSERRKPVVRVAALEDKAHYVARRHCNDFDPEQPNSSVENSYFVNNVDAFLVFIKRRLGDDGSIDPLIAAESMVTLLSHVMHEAAFNQLRTIEQLGYIVYVGQANFEHKFFLRIIIQSSIMDAASLDGRIEAFLRMWYREFLCDDDEDYSDVPPNKNEETKEKSVPLLSDSETFTTYIESLCDQLQEPPVSFSEECHNVYAEISSCRYNFDRKQQIAAFLRKLTCEDMKSFFNMYIRKSNDATCIGQNRCKFSSQFFGKGTELPSKEEEEEDTSVTYVTSPAEFKASHSMDRVVFMRK